jgi:hypothetical protein
MRTLRLGLFAALALVLAVGCRTSPNPGKVSGKVTYKGQPVKGGDIAFHSDAGTYRGTLSQEGTYEIVDMPVGAMTVTVDTDFLNPDKKIPQQGGGRGDKITAERMAAERAAGRGPPSREEMLARYTKIPLKYCNASTSTLKATVEKGKQTLNFDLTD